LRNYYERFQDTTDRKWFFSKMNEIARRYYEIVSNLNLLFRENQDQLPTQMNYFSAHLILKQMEFIQK